MPLGLSKQGGSERGQPAAGMGTGGRHGPGDHSSAPGYRPGQAPDLGTGAGGFCLDCQCSEQAGRVWLGWQRSCPANAALCHPSPAITLRPHRTPSGISLLGKTNLRNSGGPSSPQPFSTGRFTPHPPGELAQSCQPGCRQATAATPRPKLVGRHEPPGLGTAPPVWAEPPRHLHPRFASSTHRKFPGSSQITPRSSAGRAELLGVARWRPHRAPPANRGAPCPPAGGFAPHDPHSAPEGAPARAGMLRAAAGAPRTAPQHPTPRSTPQLAAGYQEHPEPCSTPSPAAPQGAPQSSPPPNTTAPRAALTAAAPAGTRTLAAAAGFVSGASPHSNRGRTSRKLHHRSPAPPRPARRHRGEPVPSTGAGRGGLEPVPEPALAASRSEQERDLPPRGYQLPLRPRPEALPASPAPSPLPGPAPHPPPPPPPPGAEGMLRPPLTRAGSGLSRAQPRSGDRERRYRRAPGNHRANIERLGGSPGARRGQPSPGNRAARRPPLKKGFREGQSARFLSVHQHRFRFPFLAPLGRCTRAAESSTPSQK